MSRPPHHAGLDQGKHPRETDRHHLLWTRDTDFYKKYRGKPCVFGHTPTAELPPRDPARATVWRRDSLIGIDTGCGRGGHLSAIELPSGTVVDSRSGRTPQVKTSGGDGCLAITGDRITGKCDGRGPRGPGTDKPLGGLMERSSLLWRLGRHAYGPDRNGHRG